MRIEKMYRDRIAELEAENQRLERERREAVHDAANVAASHLKAVDALQELKACVNPLPEIGCECSACQYLRRKQKEEELDDLRSQLGKEV